MSRAHDISGLIKEGWKQKILLDRKQRERPTIKRTHVYASAYRECLRRMVLEMTEPEALPPFDVDTLARFVRGEDRERDLLIALTRVGQLTNPTFQVIGQQEHFELTDRQGNKILSGKIDCNIAIEELLAPTEAKSWSVNLTQGINKFEDLLNNRWTKSGAYQLLMYLLGKNQPIGFMLLDKPGLPELLPVELEPNLELAEEFYAKSEVASKHAREGTLPDYHDEPSVCKTCPFYGAVCNPPNLASGNMQVISDPYQLERIERFRALRKVLKEAGLEEYIKLDKSLKEDFRGVEMALAGDALIKGKWGKQSRLELPAMLAAEWEAIRLDYTKTDPHGKFTLKIEDLE